MITIDLWINSRLLVLLSPSLFHFSPFSKFSIFRVFHHIEYTSTTTQIIFANFQLKRRSRAR